MAEILSKVCSWVITHSLLVGTLAFILLRQQLSRWLSAFIVKRYFPATSPAPQPRRHYGSFFERLARTLPDYIEDSVMAQAQRQNVAEQVRLQFLETVVSGIFMVLIALAVFTLGWLLAELKLIDADGLGSIVRLVIFGIVVQNALRLYASWETLSLQKIKNFYGTYGFNVLRLIEYQIASVVEQQACSRIDASLEGLGTVKRAMYRWFGSGTQSYARAISQKALKENRFFIRLILLLAVVAALCYYVILALLIAPMLREESGGSFFRYIFVTPFEQTVQFCGVHPLKALLFLGAAALVWRRRKVLFAALSRQLPATLSRLKDRTKRF
ncbi:MAG: hypothetical protein ACOYD9_08440 [Pyramidobacter sp.]